MVMKTPGVYIVEKSAFPNSAVQVPTAVPAFIGYTEKAKEGDFSLHDHPMKITSMSEFHNFFGNAPKPVFRLQPFEERATKPYEKDADMAVAAELPQAVFTTKTPTGQETYELVQTSTAYALYSAMRAFFLNGGGTCYVTSIGSYKDAIEADAMLKAIERLEKEPEPTMLVIPETTRLNRQNARKVQQQMLEHCGSAMKNRFAILDIHGGYLDERSPRGNPIARFRTDVGSNCLNYGAAYYPWLDSTIYKSRDFTFENIETGSRNKFISLLQRSVRTKKDLASKILRIGTEQVTGDFTISVSEGGICALKPTDIHVLDDLAEASDLKYVIEGEQATLQAQMTGKLVLGAQDATADTLSTADAVFAFSQKDIDDGKIYFVHDGNAPANGFFDLVITDKEGLKTSALTIVVAVGSQVTDHQDVREKVSEAYVIGPLIDGVTSKTTPNIPKADVIDKTMRATVPLYSDVMDAIAKYMNVMPPAAAMAGVYTSVDNTVGVWKAPANVSVAGVSGPLVHIDDAQQENLNVPSRGKSINAIRSFVGRGVIVWGARTLDGNSLDWRYINVRRTMIMIEESIRVATKAYVFEANTAQTWVTIRSMIENFLTSVWKEGGLAGAAPTDAFSVQVGLGQTMTPEDIIDGRLVVSVKVALSHPAEFIELTFQQEMQRS